MFRVASRGLGFSVAIPAVFCIAGLSACFVSFDLQSRFNS